MRSATALAVLTLALAPMLAAAYSIESVATKGCHESVTQRAVERTAWPAGADIQKPSGANAGLADALAFTVPSAADEWLIAVLIGARDNDLHGAGASEFHDLSALHNAADGQDEHCLRAPRDDDAEGDRAAVEACRAYISTQVGRALGETAEVEFAGTDQVVVALRDQTIALTLPRYPLHLGRALHALQDSFTHTYRAADFRSVTTVFNYADPATSSAYDARRDGLEHRSDFDSCDAIGTRQADRVEASITASAELMAAIASEGTRAQRLARADAVLAQWVSLAPGCSADDGWCGTAEPMPKKCSTTAGGPMLVLAIALLHRRRRTR